MFSSRPEKVAARVFLTCWLVYTALWTPYIVREHFPVMSFLEQGTLNVQRYVGWTEDIFPGPGGGAFINNNPGASLTAALVLSPLKPLFPAVERWNLSLPRQAKTPADTELFWRALAQGRAYYFLLFGFLTVMMVTAPATAGVMAYLSLRLREAGLTARQAAAAALLCGLGTPLLFRTAYLNHNLLVADAGFAALLLLWDPADRLLTSARAAMAGLLAGYCIFCDYSGAVVAATGGLYVWLRAGYRWKPVAAYCAGVLPGVAGLAIYQLWAFGSFYHPSQHYMTPTAPTSRGYRGIDWPSPALAWANFVDPRFGLFAYCPALLLALAAPFLRKAKGGVPRREMLVILAYFTLFVLFCAANQYSWLQPSTGFRYLVPVVSGLALLAIDVGRRLRPVFRWTLVVFSGAQSLLIATGHQNDIRHTPASLWKSGFQPLWMIRLGDMGAPVTALWPILLWGSLAGAIAAIWWGFFRGVAAQRG